MYTIMQPQVTFSKWICLNQYNRIEQFKLNATLKTYISQSQLMQYFVGTYYSIYVVQQ